MNCKLVIEEQIETLQELQKENINAPKSMTGYREDNAVKIAAQIAELCKALEKHK